MSAFSLKIVTPDGMAYDGAADEIIVRTTSGDMGILAGHINCVTPLGMGAATVVCEGKRRYAACIGGILSVIGGEVRLVPTAFEWSDQIDEARAQASADRARSVIADKSASETEIQAAQAQLKRAMVRLSVLKMH